jgi:deoxyxylulose-5-phosphate synthase
MQVKDILLIAAAESSALELQNHLSSYGITATITTPNFTQLFGLEVFIYQLSTHRFIITPDGTLIHNFRIQSSIREAQNLRFAVPDMWVQFGSNIGLMRQSGLDAESITQRVLQEFFVDDYCPVPQRKENAIV